MGLCDVLKSFFAPEAGAEPLDKNFRRERKQGTASLYEGLQTIYLPLIVETGNKDDTSPDLSQVVAILVANPCFDVLPPVIFIDDRFTPKETTCTYVGGAPKKLTKPQMAPIRTWVKSAFLGCDIFQRWCMAHSVEISCKFADEHPV